MSFSLSRGGKGAKGPAVAVVPDEPKEQFLRGCGVVSTMSKALCQTGAIISGQPLYKHIGAMCNNGQVRTNMCTNTTFVFSKIIEKQQIGWTETH